MYKKLEILCEYFSSIAHERVWYLEWAWVLAEDFCIKFLKIGNKILYFSYLW